jgi:outer membrane protein, multidrug efflux system
MDVSPPADMTRGEKKEEERMKLNSLDNKSLTLAVLMLLTIMGCSVGPNYQRPETALPSAWNEAQPGGADIQPTELARWWTEFNDPLLDGLVQRAVTSNLDLRLAEARIRESRGLRAATAAGEWPGLDVSGGYLRSRRSQDAFTATPGSNASPSSNTSAATDLFRVGFDSNWEIDVFGGVRRSVEAADANLQATVEDR